MPEYKKNILNSIQKYLYKTFHNNIIQKKLCWKIV